MKLKIGNIEQELKFMNKLYMENRFSEIVIRGQILNKKFPNIVPFYNILGLSYVKIGKDLLAAKIFENGLFHNQNELSLLTNLADTYRNLNKLKDSEELLKRAIHINEKDLYTLISYGRLRISQGKAEEAIDYFKRVYDIDKNFNDVILRIANAYLSIRNFKEAKKYFEMAVYETPLKIGADYSYSQMVDYSQDDKHQKHMLEKLKNKEIEKITKGPLYFAIAKSFNDQKKYDEAFKYFKLGNEDMNSRVKDKILKREKHDLEKLKYIFENFDQDLPIITQAVIVISEFIRDQFIVIALLILALIAGANIMLQKKEVKMWCHNLLLNIPIFGKLIMNSNSARYMQTLSTLSASGVPILDALKISAEVIINVPMRNTAIETVTRVSEGESISKSLSSKNLFPSMMIYMIASGEKSGKLEEMLDKATENQEEEFKNTIESLLGILQPLTVVIMAIIVLLIVLAILLPIFEINNLIA